MTREMHHATLQLEISNIDTIIDKDRRGENDENEEYHDKEVSLCI